MVALRTGFVFRGTKVLAKTHFNDLNEAVIKRELDLNAKSIERNSDDLARR